jgi:hypothetical protein
VRQLVRIEHRPHDDDAVGDLERRDPDRAAFRGAALKVA